MVSAADDRGFIMSRGFVRGRGFIVFQRLVDFGRRNRVEVGESVDHSLPVDRKAVALGFWLGKVCAPQHGLTSRVSQKTTGVGALDT